jgi:hypothetical protein
MKRTSHRRHTYSVRTWDSDLQAYTPQAGLSLPWDGLTKWELKQALYLLRAMGFDTYSILVERDDAEEMAEKREAEAIKTLEKLAKRKRKNA